MKKTITPIAIVFAAILFAPNVQAQKHMAQRQEQEPASWTDFSSLRDPYNMTCLFFKDAQNGWVAGQGIIVHTSDGGKTWEKQYTGPAHIKTIYFKNDKDGFAAGESNLYMYTHDGGATWKDVYTIFQGASFTKIFFPDEKTGYMLSTSTVYRSTDGGANWKDIGPKKPSETSTRDYTGLAFTDSKHGILVGEYEMMFTTDDGGNTWKQNTKDLFTGPRRSFWSIGFINATTGWITCSKGYEEDQNIDCLYTSDGGATWTPKKCFNNYQVHSLTFNGNCGTAGYMANSKSIMVTTDGGTTWTEQTVTDSHAARDKVFASQIFSPTSGFVGLNASDFIFHLYVPKQ